MRNKGVAEGYQEEKGSEWEQGKGEEEKRGRGEEEKRGRGEILNLEL
jgi:hypothetical protein